MGIYRLLKCAAVVAAAALANRAEAQLMYGGSLRYGPFGSVASVRGPFGGGVTSIRGPLGGRVTVAQGPFGGGAVGVRGPFGGRLTVVQPPVVPVYPVAPVYPVTPIVPVNVVQQTVLNPAPSPMPYTAGYLARIPPGMLTLQVGGANYYYTSVLPPGSQPTTVGGATYWVSNGVTYQPYFLGADGLRCRRTLGGEAHHGMEGQARERERRGPADDNAGSCRRRRRGRRPRDRPHHLPAGRRSAAGPQTDREHPPAGRGREDRAAGPGPGRTRPLREGDPGRHRGRLARAVPQDGQDLQGAAPNPVSRPGRIGVRPGQRRRRAVLLPRRPAGLSRPPLLRRTQESLSRAGRVRPGLCDRP